MLKKNQISFDIYAVAIITIVWFLSILLINPLVNFPVGDDWSYAKSVEYLVKDGQIKFTGWTSMPLLAQTLWGGAFAYFAGFSHSVLRISVLVLSLFAGISIYYIIGNFKVDNKIRIVLTIFMMYHAYFIHFAYTFATDIPFASFFLISILFLIRYINQTRFIDLFLGVLFCLVSGLIRDLALAIPFAFAVVMIYINGFQKKTILISSFFIALSIAEWIGFRLWLSASADGLPILYDDARRRLMQPFSFPIIKALAFWLKNIITVFIFISFFTFPFSLNEFLKSSRDILFSKKLLLLIASFFSIITFVGSFKFGIDYFITEFIYAGAAMPNVFILTENYAFMPNKLITIIVSLFSFFASFSFIYWIYFLKQKYNTENKKIKALVIFLLLIAIIYLIPILIAGPYNRYLIIPLFLVLISACIKMPISIKKINLASIFIIVFMVYWGFAGAHDMLAMIKAKSEVITCLEYKNIKPSQIDGGFEYNGWHFYNEKYLVDPNKNWWWVQNDDYAVLNGLTNKSSEICRKEYYRWFPFAYKGYIVAVKKQYK